MSDRYEGVTDSAMWSQPYVALLWQPPNPKGPDMPAIRRYTVTRVQTVEVTTVNGYEDAQRLGLATLTGETIGQGSVLVMPGTRPTDGHTDLPVTRSVHVDLATTERLP